MCLLWGDTACPAALLIPLQPLSCHVQGRSKTSGLKFCRKPKLSVYSRVINTLFFVDMKIFSFFLNPKFLVNFFCSTGGRIWGRYEKEKDIYDDNNFSNTGIYFTVWYHTCLCYFKLTNVSCGHRPGWFCVLVSSWQVRRCYVCASLRPWLQCDACQELL